MPFAASQPSAVVSPANEAEVAAVLAAATAHELAVVARGGGTKLDWGAPPDALRRRALHLAHRGHRRPRARGPGVRRARGHDTRGAAGRGSRPHAGFRQRLMLDPPQGADATLGGVVATAASGPLRTRFGTPRDLVIGASFVLSDGTVGRSGGKVVKNVAGFDIAKLLTGSLGTLAVITELAFRLHPCPRHRRPSCFESRSVDELCAFAAAVGRLQVTPSVVDLHWPDGIVVVRFDSSVARRGCPGRACDADEPAGASSASRRPTSRWQPRSRARRGRAPAASPRIAVLPSRAAALLTAMSGGTCEALVLRPLLGTGEVRFAPDATSDVATAVRNAGGRLVMRRGDGAPMPARTTPSRSTSCDRSSAGSTLRGR